MQRSRQPSARRYRLERRHVRLGGTKTRRVDTLPLPAATGAAIAAYLRDERPRTSNRAIFVRHVAPYDTPIDSGVVQRAVMSGLQAMRMEALARPYYPAQRREPAVAGGHAHEGDRRCSPASQSRYVGDLHQGRFQQTGFGGVALARECVMIESRSMVALASDYFAERRPRL